MNTRSLQRTLFRMQADASFAEALLAGEEAAWDTTDLGQQERELLLDGVDRSSLSADPGGKRRTQILGNVASEFTTSLAALAHDGRADLLDRFLAAPEFHEALRRDGRLPLAFGAYLSRRAREEGRSDWESLIELERGLVELRRSAWAASPPATPHPPGDCSEPRPVTESVGKTQAPSPLALTDRVRLLELPGGTHRQAQAWRQSLEGGAAPQPLPAGEPETLLLARGPDPGPHRLADVRVELLAPPANTLLADAGLLASPDARARFAAEQGATAEDLEAFLADFVIEGVLEPIP